MPSVRKNLDVIYIHFFSQVRLQIDTSQHEGECEHEHTDSDGEEEHMGASTGILQHRRQRHYNQ